MKSQLKELWSTEMLKPMFSNLNALAAIALSIPISTVSTERSFSVRKLIKIRLCSSVSDSNLSHQMKTDIESPDSHTDSELKDIVDVHVYRIESVEEYPSRLTPF